MSDPHFDVSSVCGKISWKMVQCHVNILEFISCVCLSRGSMGTEKSWPQRVATTAQRNDTVEWVWQKTTVLKDDICNTYTRWNKTALRKERKTSIDFFFSAILPSSPQERSSVSLLRIIDRLNHWWHFAYYFPFLSCMQQIGYGSGGGMRFGRNRYFMSGFSTLLQTTKRHSALFLSC